MAETPKPQAESEKDEARRLAEESARIESLRERLYSRGAEVNSFTRHELGSTAHTTPPGTVPQKVVSDISPRSEQVSLSALIPSQPMPRTSPRSSFRAKFAIVGIIFFVIALAVSSVFLFMGNNTISGNNITIDVNGPLSVGGGDVMDLQIAIANQNSLPIESATLIITYPRGAQSVVEPGRELFSERQQLNNIDPNEVVNVPVRALIFGEENDEMTVGVSVEYRVRGSNATFYKEALPYTFKVSMSPVVLNIDSVKSIPSGQETDVTVSVVSNSKETLTDLILKVDYPQGFDFTKSSPETSSGQDIWKLKSLKPGEEQKIVITGVVTGNENAENEFNFTVGVANERDAFDIVSPLATREVLMSIERPFLDVDIRVNGDSDETVVIEPSSTASVVIEFANALESTVYDGVIQVKLGGNALDEVEVKAQDGYYDSRTNTLTWDAVDVDALRELAPGEKRNVSFGLAPRGDIDTTPEITLAVTIQGNRVSEDRVPEQVVGTIERTIKVASITKLASSVIYSDGPFSNSGPLPPIAEKTTQYSFLFTVKNGTNPVTGAEVTATMPAYVTWLDMTSDDDAVSYNSSNRTLKWTLGELKANEYREVWVQVAFQPSLSQVGLTPTLLESQRYRATDRFTGTTVRSEAPALTTYLINEPGGENRDGRVRKN